MEMKRFWLSILTLLMSLCCAFGLAACNEKEAQKVLVDFTDAELVIEYGDTYTIETYVYDTEGASYPLSVKITDSNGEEVACENELTVSKPMYTVVYSVQINGGTSQKTVTISVSSRPIITLDKEERIFALGILPYTIPEIKVMDDVDGEITDYVKEIYYVNGVQEEKTNYNGTDVTFIPEKIGTYYLKVTATNKMGVSNSEKVMFTVRVAGEVNFMPSAANAEKFSGGEYVAAENLPTDGIDNTAGYAGNAIKSTRKSGTISYLSMNYSASEYQAMADRGDFNMVTFSYLIVSASAVTNNEGESYKGLLSQAGITGQTPNTVTCNAWQTITIKVKDFCKAMQTGDYDETTLLFARIWTKEESVDLYLGEIKFEKKDVELLNVATCIPAVSLLQKKGDNYNSVKATLVKNEDLPVSGYSGDALHMNIGSTYCVYAALAYTLEELEELAERYESAVINVLFMDNDNSRKPVEGVIGPSRVNSGLGTWLKEVIPLDKIMFNMGRDGRPLADRPQDNKLLLLQGYNNGNFELYLGDITLVPKAASSDTKLLDIKTAESGNTVQQCNDVVWGGSDVLTVDNAYLPTREGYDGDAVKIYYKSQFNLYVTLKYTKAEIERLKDKYESAEINFMFADDDGNRTFGAGIIKKADVTLNTWCKKRVTLDELQSYMGTGIDTEPKVENKLLLYKGWTNGNLYVYVGDINLIEKSNEEKKPFDVETVTNASSVLKQVKGSGWASTAAAKATKVANADLPDNTNYQGDALKLKFANSYSAYVTLNYTKAELEAMKEKYDSVEINVLFEKESGTTYYPTDGLFKGILAENNITYDGKWHKITFTLDQIISFMGAKYSETTATIEDNQLWLSKVYASGFTAYMYLGDITFVEKTAE